MAENFNVKEARKKAVQTLHQDGVLDIMWGFICLVVGVYLYFNVMHDNNIIILLILPSFMVGPLVTSIRKRFTYPRIGYVDIRTTQRMVIFLIASLVFLAAGVFFLVARNLVTIPYIFFRSLPVIILVLLGAFFLYFAQRYSFKRYYLYVLAVIAAIAMVFLLGQRMLVNFIYSLFVIAAVMIPVGIYTFAKFIAANPILTDQSEQFKDNEAQRKSFAFIYQDGLDEIYLGLNFLVWVVAYLIFRQFGTVSLYVLLIIPPIIFAFLTYSARKNSTFTHLEDNEINSLVKGRSFLRNFMVMFLVNLAGLAVFSVQGIADSAAKEFGFVPALMFICLGLYYLIIATMYKTKRFFFASAIAFCCNLLYLFDLAPTSTFLIGSGVLAVTALLTGWSGKEEYVRKLK
jgi:hypothetical protein